VLCIEAYIAAEGAMVGAEDDSMIAFGDELDLVGLVEPFTLAPRGLGEFGVVPFKAGSKLGFMELFMMIVLCHFPNLSLHHRAVGR
jgi:hypothetical protein